MACLRPLRFIRFTLLRDLFKQKRLWGWLALVFIATTGMSGWLKWQTDGMNPGELKRRFGILAAICC